MAKNITGYLMPALLLALALPIAAYAADAGSAAAKQASTASAHAGMALGAANLKMAQTHLHHVVNCLVGTSGAGFDAAAGNPCKGMGNGAIADAKGDAVTETKLKEALAQANDGIVATTLEATHADAQKAMNTLQAK
ncbi:MAG: hypothetical protein ABI114_10415 [Rhodanobacter sp.]